MHLLRGTRFAVLVAALAAIVGLPGAASAQQAGTVRGTVTDSSTRGAVAGAQVSIIGSTRGTVTNDAGAYTLAGVPAGPATVRVQRIGFTPDTRPVVIAGGTVVTESPCACAARRR